MRMGPSSALTRCLWGCALPIAMLLTFLSFVGLASYGLHAYLFWRIRAIVLSVWPDATATVEVILGAEATLAFSLLTLSYFLIGSVLPAGRLRVLAARTAPLQRGLRKDL